MREDALQLFGFVDARERALFHLLRSVTGIGPRTALSVLSGMPVDGLLALIAAGDRDAWLQPSRASAKRIAERMVVELREPVHGSQRRRRRSAPRRRRTAGARPRRCRRS